MKITSTVFCNTETRINCNGSIPVMSPWSDGKRSTRFAVAITSDHMVRWWATGHSRVPNAADVAEALQYVLGGYEPAKGNVYWSKNCVGTNYAHIGGYRMAIDANDKLSMGGSTEEMPAHIAKKLVSAVIDRWLEEHEHA